MRNKKGKIPAGEMFGMLSWGFIAAVVVLFFWGCEAKREIVKYNTFEDSKAEVEAVKALNLFLGMPLDSANPGKKVLDLVIESYLADPAGGTDYPQLDSLAEVHFNTYSEWRLILETGGVVYNSCTGPRGRPPCGDVIPQPEAEIDIPIIKQNGELEEVLTVSLQII